MRNFLQRRNIEMLVHFTRCSNLESIFTHGLLTRQYLNDREYEYECNDLIRLDGHEDATCLSITFPNYKMFYSLRCSEPEEEWAVLGVYANILLENDCAFFKENAASINETAIPLREKRGLAALKVLFDDCPPPRCRIFLGIDENMTTNPQSEVLVFNNIAIEEIFGVAFNNTYTRNKYIHVIPDNVEVIIDDYLFSGRIDYEFWR